MTASTPGNLGTLLLLIGICCSVGGGPYPASNRIKTQPCSRSSSRDASKIPCSSPSSGIVLVEAVRLRPITVTARRAAGIPDVDPWPGQGHSDAKVTITMNAVSYQSAYIESTANPTWNFGRTYYINPLSYIGTTVTFTVNDDNSPLGDTYLGVWSVGLPRLDKGVTVFQNGIILDGSTNNGRIYVEFYQNSFGTATEELTESTYLLSATPLFVSRTKSHSDTVTPANTQSWTNSKSLSVSVSKTESSTPTASVSYSTSLTPTLSTSDTYSRSHSLSVTASDSISHTRTSSWSTSPTTSATWTNSLSQTPTNTNSLTSSISSSLSWPSGSLGTSSPSHTNSQTVSRTTSASSTQSSSRSLSPSKTLSLSGSLTSTVTNTLHPCPDEHPIAGLEIPDVYVRSRDSEELSNFVMADSDSNGATIVVRSDESVPVRTAVLTLFFFHLEAAAWHSMIPWNRPIPRTMYHLDLRQEVDKKPNPRGLDMGIFVPGKTANLTRLNETWFQLDLEMNHDQYLIDIDEELMVSFNPSYLIRCIPDAPMHWASVHVVATRNIQFENTHTAVAVVTTASTIGSLLGATTAAMDAQALAVMGLLSCTQPAQKKSMKNNRLLSPLAVDDTFEGMVIGNWILIGAAIFLHFGLVACLKVFKKKNHGKEKASSPLSWGEAQMFARFPALTLQVAVLQYQGTAAASIKLLQDRSSPVNSLTLGGISVVFALAVPFLFTFMGWYFITATFHHYNYGIADGEEDPKKETRPTIMPTRLNKIPIFLRKFLPVGKWVPLKTKRRFGPLFAGIKRNEKIWCSVATWNPTVILLGMLFRPSSKEGCAAQFGAMSGVIFILGGFIIYLRPYRSATANTLAVASYWCISSVLTGNAIQAMYDGNRVVAQYTMRMIQLQMAITILRMLWSIFQVCYEIKVMRGVPLTVMDARGKWKSYKLRCLERSRLKIGVVGSDRSGSTPPNGAIELEEPLIFGINWNYNDVTEDEEMQRIMMNDNAREEEFHNTAAMAAETDELLPELEGGETIFDSHNQIAGPVEETPFEVSGTRRASSASLPVRKMRVRAFSVFDVDPELLERAQEEEKGAFNRSVLSPLHGGEADSHRIHGNALLGYDSRDAATLPTSNTHGDGNDPVKEGLFDSFFAPSSATSKKREYLGGPRSEHQSSTQTAPGTNPYTFDTVYSPQESPSLGPATGARPEADPLDDLLATPPPPLPMDLPCDDELLGSPIPPKTTQPIEGGGETSNISMAPELVDSGGPVQNPHSATTRRIRGAVSATPRRQLGFKQASSEEGRAVHKDLVQSQDLLDLL